MIDPKSMASPLLDPRQLIRIEAVHRGYLYQHLYAAACLLSARRAGVTSIVVERDEDVEIVLASKRLYVQVKTRSEPLTFSDIGGPCNASMRYASSTRSDRGRARPALSSPPIFDRVPPYWTSWGEPTGRLTFNYTGQIGRPISMRHCLFHGDGWSAVDQGN